MQLKEGRYVHLTYDVHLFGVSSDKYLQRAIQSACLSALTAQWIKTACPFSTG